MAFKFGDRVREDTGTEEYYGRVVDQPDWQDRVLVEWDHPRRTLAGITTRLTTSLVSNLELQQPASEVAAGDQPPPTPNQRPAIQDLVIRDIAERKRVGVARYGTPLQGFNGRDALMDAYQEALDLVQYLRQAIYERDALAGNE